MHKMKNFIELPPRLSSAISIASRNEKINPVPYSCVFNEFDYWNYAYNYKRELLDFFRKSYIVIRHKHSDIYVHETTYNKVDKILSDGFLIGYDDNNSLGKAIYTFPLSSGRISALRYDSYYIVFSSSEEHCHIVGTDDSNHELGESDFLVDKLEIKHPRVYTQKEMYEFSRLNFDSENVLSNYYGIGDMLDVNYDNLCEIVTSFN